MIHSSHFIALSFGLFFGGLWYKKFFGLGNYITDAIGKIDHDIQKAHEMRKSAAARLDSVQLKLHEINSRIYEIQDRNQKAIEKLTNRKMQELAKSQDDLELAHGKQLQVMDEQFARLYKDQFVALLMQSVRDALQQHMTAANLDMQLNQSLDQLSACALAARV